MNDDKNGKKRDLFQTIENKHTVLFDDVSYSYAWFETNKLLNITEKTIKLN